LVIAEFERLTTQPAWRAFAKLVRCEPARAGDPTCVDATIPGFCVTTSQLPNQWVLEGSHLFPRYALAFRITPIDGGHCRVQAIHLLRFPVLMERPIARS
jgi:hypothetical protein